ncbi:MAG TPA: hypothetical protein VF171_04070, partial [Trueperaceae bacterium]
MRLLLALLFALSPAAFATREVVAPHLRVLYDDPALSEYAQRAAANAERALAALAPLWGPERERVTLTLDASTDVFNAFARVLPHPGVTLRPLFPTEDELAYGARDPLYLLLLHELTHVQQLNYGALPPGEAGLPDLGLVGEDLAPPPSWFLEGVATYLESTLATGGRLQDARTRGLLQSLALSGRWPTLAEAGLVTFEDWPGGETRYLLGAAFIDHLVRHYGWDAILATLRAYNARVLTGTFAGAWRQATGTSLFEEWDAWHAEIRAAARARATNARPGRLLTHTGWSTSGPAVSPDGKHLAWVSWPPAIRLAELGKDG